MYERQPKFGYQIRFSPNFLAIPTYFTTTYPTESKSFASPKGRKRSTDRPSSFEKEKIIIIVPRHHDRI